MADEFFAGKCCTLNLLFFVSSCLCGTLGFQEVIRLVSSTAVVVDNVLYFENDTFVGQVVRIGDST